MKKMGRYEGILLVLTLLFVFGTGGYFFLENQSQPLALVETAKEEMPDLDEEIVAPELLEGEQINLNTANAEDIARLPSIGESRALDIIAYREATGGFQNIEELMNVKGIGEKTFATLRPYLTV